MDMKVKSEGFHIMFFFSLSPGLRRGSLLAGLVDHNGAIPHKLAESGPGNMLYGGTPLWDCLPVCGQLGHLLEATAHAGTGNTLAHVCLLGHDVPSGNRWQGVATEHAGGN